MYETEVIAPLNFKPPTNLKGDKYERWYKLQGKLLNDEPTIHKDFWIKVKKRFRHEVCDRVKKMIYDSQYHLKIAVQQKCMNVDLKEKRIGSDFDLGSIEKRHKMVKKVTKDGPLEHNNGHIVPLIPFAVMKDGTIDESMMIELRRINQELHHHYWPNVKKICRTMECHCTSL